MYRSVFSSLILALFWLPQLFAQVVTTDPALPRVSDSITLFFDASQGSAGLAGFNGDIYIHTGVITSESTSSSDWKHVIADWGVNIPKAKLTRDSSNPNLYSLQIDDVKDYYGITNPNENILRLAMVFRSATQVNGVWLEGKTETGGDIFVDLAQGDLNVVFVNPSNAFDFVDANSSLEVLAVASATDTQNLTLTLFQGNTQIATVENDSLPFTIADLGPQSNTLSVVASNASADNDTAFYRYIVRTPEQALPRPSGIDDGINLNQPSVGEVTFSLFAPFKSSVYLIGDFTDWEILPEFQLSKDEISTDSVHYWITVSGLNPNQEYGFQYLVDESIRVADPYSTKILDEFNDRFILQSTFPNLKPYPVGKTSNPVGVFKINEDSYEWTITDFDRPDKEDLVIYELLVRDFVEASNYQTLTDTLNYLKTLGVNAIELMPVAEFDGNDSWGYNPAFHMALDKYYGTPNAFKTFVDSAHAKGMAVILDEVFNHATGQSPLIGLYWDSVNNRPAANSPYAFTSAQHPFNVFNDLNHESPALRHWFLNVLRHWITEFNIDGFRFDLSKGHTNRSFGGDVGAWSAFNQWRVDHWKANYDFIQGVDPGFYVILEHLAEFREDNALADHGMMLWHNMNRQYSQISMGWWNSNDFPNSISDVYWKNRNFSKPHQISYMESHDEQWLMFRNLAFGRSSNSEHNVKNLDIALERQKLAAAFFLTVPGPKMLWQFAELGYGYGDSGEECLRNEGGDECLNNAPSRVGRKPVRWDYFSDKQRVKVYKTWSALLKLRNENIAFTDDSALFTSDLGEDKAFRWMKIKHESMDVLILGNFDVSARNVNLPIDAAETGTWYRYFTGERATFSEAGLEITLRPGEFRIYTTKQLEIPEIGIITDNEEEHISQPEQFELRQNFPNPFNPSTNISFSLPISGEVQLEVFNMLGQRVAILLQGQRLSTGVHTVSFDARNLASGIYIYRIRSGNFTAQRKMTLIK